MSRVVQHTKHRPRAITFALVLVVASGCTADGGSPTTPDQVTGAAGPTAATGGTGGTGGTGATGPVPDACALLAPNEIEAVIRTDPGTGSTSGSEERSICIYPNGLILAVERAANYEASKEIIEAERRTEPVTGVGLEAFWDPAGQLVALGEHYLVGVTMVATGRKAKERAAQIATIMLDNV